MGFKTQRDGSLGASGPAMFKGSERWAWGPGGPTDSRTSAQLATGHGALPLAVLGGTRAQDLVLTLPLVL